ILGHCADSQTVCNPNPRASFLRLWKFSPTGALALSHSGLGCLIGGARSICTNWEAPAICSFDFTCPIGNSGSIVAEYPFTTEPQRMLQLSIATVSIRGLAKPLGFSVSL